MDRIRGSPEAAVTLVGLRAVGRFSPRTQRFLVNSLGIKATAVITNVKGPEMLVIDYVCFWTQESKEAML